MGRVIKTSIMGRGIKKSDNNNNNNCVISRYFTLRQLGRLLTPFITKFCFRAKAFMQQRPEVTSEFGLGVVGRVIARLENDLSKIIQWYSMVS